MSKLLKSIKELESARELARRLEKIVDKLDDALGDESLIEVVESDVRLELPFAEKGFISLTGQWNSNMAWRFEDIIDRWIEIYPDDTDEDNAALRKMGDEFCKLGKMFYEAADLPVGITFSERNGK